MPALFSIDDIPSTELLGRRVMVRIEAEDDLTLQNSLSTIAFLSRSGARVIIDQGRNCVRLSIESAVA